MRIKVCNDEGCARVEVIQPGGDGTADNVASCTTVEEGQEVTIALPNVANPGEITVNPVEDTPAEESTETTE